MITTADGTNDLQGADAPATLATGVAVTTAAAKGVAVYYWRTAPSPLRRRRVLRALRSFNYTITDQDGDTRPRR